MKAHREARGLRQEDLSVAGGGPTIATIRAIENGYRSRPYPDSLAQLERGLHWVPGSFMRTAMGGEPWLTEAMSLKDLLVIRRNDLGYGHRDQWCRDRRLDPMLVAETERGQRHLVVLPDQMPAWSATDHLAVDTAYQLAPGTTRRFLAGEIDELIPLTAPVTAGGATGMEAALAVNGATACLPFQIQVAGEVTGNGGVPRWRNSEERDRWMALAKIPGMSREGLITNCALHRMMDAAAGVTAGPGLARTA
ncbi:MAG TPA: helix-turn-helix transcriptional regulator [Urbifossiella sp.]|nr:helix-turn-helix transcriptional regulator [Urbifossiella sp.]